MSTPDGPRWLIEIPETSGVCLEGVQCRLLDRWCTPWRVVWIGTREECEAAIEAAELLDGTRVNPDA